MGDAIQDGIDAMSDLIDALLDQGILVQDFEPADESISSIQEHKTVCITGKLPSGKKKSDYKTPLLAAGFELVDKVSKDLDYLVLADPSSNSSKAQKAKKFGVTLISEKELQKLI